MLIELARGAKGLIRMVGNQTILAPPQEEGNAGGENNRRPFPILTGCSVGSKAGAGSRATEKKPQVFSFDKSYWSAGDRGDSDYCSQQVYTLSLSRFNG